jgi:membrane-bound lytic murein transglycosylase B
VIKRYNNANSYALAVSYLSNQIVGKTAVIAAWPSDDIMLTRDERQSLQQLLTQSGFDTQGIDGRIGPNTRFALRAWQRKTNLVADGYINKKRFEYLKKSSRKHLSSTLLAHDKKEMENE